MSPSGSEALRRGIAQGAPCVSVTIPAAGEPVRSSSMSRSLEHYSAGSSSPYSNGLNGSLLITSRPETQSTISLPSLDWPLLPLLFATMGEKGDTDIKFFALYAYCII